MATTTFDLLKAASLTNYKKPLRIKAEPSWDWERLYTIGTTNRGEERFFGYGGLPVAQARGELQRVPYYDIAELGESVLTIGKWMIGTRLSREAVKDNQHIPNLLGDIASMQKESHTYAVDQLAAEPYIYAFDGTTQPMHDSAAMCSDSHKLLDDSTYDNYLGTTSPTYDSVWSDVNNFEWNLKNHNGLPMFDKVESVVVHTSKIPTWQKILENKAEPDTADRNDNFMASRRIKIIGCPYLSSLATTAYFYVGAKMKKNMIWLWRERIQTKEAEDDDVQAYKLWSWQRHGKKIIDFLPIFGCLGS